MDYGTPITIKIIYGLLAGLMILGGFAAYNEYTKSNIISDQKTVATMAVDNAMMTLENPITDNTNDYFVVTNDDKAFYITVVGQEGQYSPTVQEIDEENNQLNEMLKTTMERANKPEPRNNTTIIPMPIPMK